MEGRAHVVCTDCGRTREVSGEMPREYSDCFRQIVVAEGFVPRPGGSGFLCGACLASYEGSETRDDAEKLSS